MPRPSHTFRKQQSGDFSPGPTSQEGHPWVPETVGRAGTCLRVAWGDFIWRAAPDLCQASRRAPPVTGACTSSTSGAKRPREEVSSLRPHTLPEAKAGDPGSPDSQPLAFATWSSPGPSVRGGAFWKSLGSYGPSFLLTKIRAGTALLSPLAGPLGPPTPAQQSRAYPAHGRLWGREASSAQHGFPGITR